VLYNFIGPYKIYLENVSSNNSQNLDYIAESKMKKLAIDKFRKHRVTLNDALSCEDYQDTGILELT